MGKRFPAALGLLSAAVWCSSAWGEAAYLSIWQARYPTSTLPTHMTLVGGSACDVCHHPPSPFTRPGNCYREELTALMGGGLLIEEAIDQADGMDSDGDGVSNGEEITTPRTDDPGQIGYNPGLIGSQGTDPCGTDPDEAVTGTPETPPIVIPTVSEWGLILLTLSLLTGGTLVIARRRRLAL